MNRRGRPRKPRLARLSVAIDSAVAEALERRLERLKALVGPGLALTRTDMVEMALRAFLRSEAE